MKIGDPPQYSYKNRQNKYKWPPTESYPLHINKTAFTTSDMIGVSVIDLNIFFKDLLKLFI